MFKLNHARPVLEKLITENRSLFWTTCDSGSTVIVEKVYNYKVVNKDVFMSTRPLYISLKPGNINFKLHILKLLCYPFKLLYSEIVYKILYLLSKEMNFIEKAN